MLIVLSEADAAPPTSINGRELRAQSEAARLFGWRVIPIPADFSICETAEAAMAYVPSYHPPAPALWIGFIPTIERYSAMYEAAAARGIHLLNRPSEHQTAMEFDHAYSRLGALTPESAAATTVEDAVAAAERLGFPVFLKGVVKSNKEQGWVACVAEDSAAVEQIVALLLAREGRSRGRVIVRRLVQLRQSGAAPGGFPLGREYRVFLYRQEVLAQGYYWDEHADPFPLTLDDAGAVRRVAVEAARRVGTPFLAVDVAQTIDGEWIVIEVGDAQFSGLSHVPVLELWAALQRKLGDDQ